MIYHTTCVIRQQGQGLSDLEDLRAEAIKTAASQLILCG